MKSGKLLIVSASSGAGKTTLVQEVIECLNPYHIKRVVTYTSKQPRPGEVDGRDYHFVSEEEFKKKIDQNFFVEYSTVYGAYYGFPETILQEIDRGARYIGIVDQAGAASIKARKKDAILFWINPPDDTILKQRLVSRAQDCVETIDFRLSLVEQEKEFLAQKKLFDHIIVNNDLQKAVAELERIIKNLLGAP